MGDGSFGVSIEVWEKGRGFALVRAGGHGALPYTTMVAAASGD
jgi:hypothetical protein